MLEKRLWLDKKKQFTEVSFKPLKNYKNKKRLWNGHLGALEKGITWTYVYNPFNRNKTCISGCKYIYIYLLHDEAESGEQGQTNPSKCKG